MPRLSLIEKSIASALGVSDLKLTTSFNNGLLGLGKTTTTFISSMQVSGDSLTDNNLKLVEEKDRDLGRMLRNANEKLQGSIKNEKLVNIEIKNVLNKQNKMVTTLSISTPFDNIITGSVLDRALSGQSLTRKGEMAYFAMSSTHSGQIFEVKPAASGDASRAQRQDLSPVADKAENTNPAANDKMDAVKTPVTKPTVPGIVSGIGHFFGAVFSPVAHGIAWLSQVTGFSHIVSAAIYVKGWVFGKVFTVLSGDVLDKKTDIKFDKDKSKPAVITINGMSTNDFGAKEINDKAMEAFGIEYSTFVRNCTHWFGVGDVVQMFGHEFFGAYDKPVMDSVAAIRQGIADKGEVFVVAHSQGTAIFVRALDLLIPAERAKIHYYGAGSEWFVDANKFGLASARNVYNKGDLVPGIGNLFNPINWAMPGRWYRVGQGITEGGEGNTSWAVIDVSHGHSFTQAYSIDMKQWASEQIANYKQGVDSATIQTSSNIDNGFNDIASNSLRAGSGFDQQSGIFAYSGEEVSHQSGVGGVPELRQQRGWNTSIWSFWITGEKPGSFAISNEVDRSNHIGYSSAKFGVSGQTSEEVSYFRRRLCVLLCGDNQIFGTAMGGESSLSYMDSYVRSRTAIQDQIRTGDLVQAAASSISYNRDNDSLPMDVKPNINPGEGATLVNPSSPLSPNTIMPKVAGVFFYNDSRSFNDFYQASNAKSSTDTLVGKPQYAVATDTVHTAKIETGSKFNVIASIGGFFKNVFTGVGKLIGNLWHGVLDAGKWVGEKLGIIQKPVEKTKVINEEVKYHLNGQAYTKEEVVTRLSDYSQKALDLVNGAYKLSSTYTGIIDQLNTRGNIINSSFGIDSKFAISGDEFSAKIDDLTNVLRDVAMLTGLESDGDYQGILDNLPGCEDKVAHGITQLGVLENKVGVANTVVNDILLGYWRIASVNARMENSQTFSLTDSKVSNAAFVDKYMLGVGTLFDNGLITRQEKGALITSGEELHSQMYCYNLNYEHEFIAARDKFSDLSLEIEGAKEAALPLAVGAVLAVGTVAFAPAGVALVIGGSLGVYGSYFLGKEIGKFSFGYDSTGRMLTEDERRKAAGGIVAGCALGLALGSGTKKIFDVLKSSGQIQDDAGKGVERTLDSFVKQTFEQKGELTVRDIADIKKWSIKLEKQGIISDISSDSHSILLKEYARLSGWKGDIDVVIQAQSAWNVNASGKPIFKFTDSFGSDSSSKVKIDDFSGWEASSILSKQADSWAGILGRVETWWRYSDVYEKFGSNLDDIAFSRTNRGVSSGVTENKGFGRLLENTIETRQNTIETRTGFTSGLSQVADAADGISAIIQNVREQYFSDRKFEGDAAAALACSGRFSEAWQGAWDTASVRSGWVADGVTRNVDPAAVSSAMTE